MEKKLNVRESWETAAEAWYREIRKTEGEIQRLKIKKSKEESTNIRDAEKIRAIEEEIKKKKQELDKYEKKYLQFSSRD